MAKYGSGSKKVTPNVGLRTSRYQYLALEDAEPNLGFTTEKVLPLKDNYYQLVSFDGGTVYDRYWQVAPAGIITGISIFDEGFIVGTGNSINKLDFRGNIITATANDFGTISTITVAPPGSDTQLIYNSGGNFAASANLRFSSNILSVTGLGSFSQGSYNQNVRIGVASNNVIDTTSGNLVLDANSGITSIKSVLLAGITTFSGSNSSNLVTLSQTGTGNALFANGTVISGLGSIGVGTTVPTQELDVNGDVRIRGTIYDYNNQPGNNSDILIKNSVGGLEWVNQSTVETGAGGTYTNIQYHTYAGKLGGAPNFVYESNTSRVGIGTTIPIRILHLSQNSAAEFIIEQSNSRADFKKWNFVADGGSAEAGTTGNFYLRLLNDAGNATSKLYWYINGSNNTQSFYDTVLINSASPTGTASQPLQVTGGAYISGSFGIATTSPAAKLHVVGDAQVDGNIRVGISTTSNYIAFRGTYLDDQTTYTHTFIGERIYESGTEKSELLLFKGNDPLGNPGPDRIRLAAGEFRFDTYYGVATSGTFEQVATSANITNKMILTGDGNLGIGTTLPTSKLDVNGNVRVVGVLTATTGARFNNINVGILGANTISTPTGNLTLDSSAGTTVINDILSVDDISATTSTTDGALVVKGGVGIAGSLNIGGHIAVGSTFGVTGTSFLKQSIISGIASFTNTTESTNKDTGSVIVEGGVGIEKNLNVGGASSISGITTFGSNVLPFNNSTQDIGSSSQRWSNVWATTFNGKFLGNADTAGYATTAGMSTNLVGGSAGVVPYQSGSNQTLFTQVGTAKSLLQSNGSSAPTWINPGTLNVAYASSAGISTNLAGGSAGVVPYQNNTGITSFTQVGTANSLLQSNGSNAPTWIDPGTLKVAYASSAGISTNLVGTVVGSIPYQSGNNQTSFTQVGTAGSLLQSNGAGAPTWVEPSGLSVKFAGYATTAGIATNLGGGTAGQVPWQIGIDSTRFTTGGSTGQLLQFGGATGPTWISPLGLFVQNAGYATTAGIATYATNAGVATYATKAGLSTNLVSNNSTGQVPYQSADNTTLFTTGGIGGNLLQYNGLTGPVWTSPQGLTIGYANTSGIATYATKAGIATYADNAGIATNLKGISGNIGQVPWQSGISTTSFTTGGVSGSSLLQYNGTSAPTWVSPTNLTVQNALYADNAGIATHLKGGSGGSIPYQTGSSQTQLLENGSTGQLLTSGGGTSAPSWTSPQGLLVNRALYADNAGIATHLKGGSGGSIPYQTGSSQTQLLENGSTGQLLTSGGGTSAPSWTSPQGLLVNRALYADNAGIATNIKGGGYGQIPYQSDVSKTELLAAGQLGQLLTSGGNSTPYLSWTSPQGLLVNRALYADNAGIATNIKGGSGGQIPWQTEANKTSFTTGGSSGSSLLQYGGSTGPTWVSPTNLTVQNAIYAANAGIATNIKGGSYGQIPYQTSSNITELLPAGSNGQLLTSLGNVAPYLSWTSPQGLTVQNANFALVATAATNIRNGAAGQIPYQTGQHSTAFVQVGSAGSILESQGSSPPRWINPNTTASKSIVAVDTNNNNTRYITFVENTSGSQTLLTESSLTYITATDTLSVPKVNLTNILNGGTTIATFSGSGQQVTSFGVGTVPSSISGEIRATNNITAYFSDERLKENIRLIPSALSKLLSLRGVTYNSNELAEQYGYTDKKEQVGVIAQDVEAILPQIVVPAPFDIAQDEDGNEYSKSGKNYKTVQYDKLVPLLIEAIKEQQETIINLQRRIEDLEK